MSQVERLVDTLSTGEELTAKQIRTRFGAKNPYRAVHRAREAGYPIYLNERRDSSGRVKLKYRLGSPSKAVISAGYRALSEERITNSFLRSL